MKTLIKNCGLSTPESVACAIATGATFIGFVHHPAPPRNLTADAMVQLYRHAATTQKVAVLVDPSDDLLASLPKPDFWQVHNVSDPARIHAIHQSTGIPVITGIRVRAREDIMHAAGLEEVSAHLLFDAYHPQEAGGSGHAFDWSLLSGQTLKKPWFLAGGLNEGNIANAIRVTHAPMVDVSSGLETAPGKKSLEKIAAFNAAVLHAAHA